MEFIENIKKNLNGFYISLVIVSIGVFFIHIKFNSPINWELFLSTLPLSWFMLFILMCGFILFLGGDKKGWGYKQ